MDVYTASPLEICLERHQSFADRIPAAVMLIGFPALMGWAIQHSADGMGAQIIIAAIFMAILCLFAGVVFVGTALADNVRWTIQFGKIRIERESAFGRKQVDTIAIGDISDISIHRYDPLDSNVSFCIAVQLNSGNELYSPTVATEAEAKDIQAKTRLWLQVGAG